MESADGQIGFASAAHLTLDVKLSKENLERPKFRKFYKIRQRLVIFIVH